MLKRKIPAARANSRDSTKEEGIMTIARTAFTTLKGLGVSDPNLVLLWLYWQMDANHGRIDILAVPDFCSVEQHDRITEQLISKSIITVNSQFDLIPDPKILESPEDQTSGGSAMTQTAAQPVPRLAPTGNQLIQRKKQPKLDTPRVREFSRGGTPARYFRRVYAPARKRSSLAFNYKLSSFSNSLILRISSLKKLYAHYFSPLSRFSNAQVGVIQDFDRILTEFSNENADIDTTTTLLLRKAVSLQESIQNPAEKEDPKSPENQESLFSSHDTNDAVPAKTKSRTPVDKAKKLKTKTARQKIKTLTKGADKRPDLTIPQPCKPFFDLWMSKPQLRKFRDRKNGVFKKSIDYVKKFVNGSLFGKLEQYAEYSNRRFTFFDFEQALSEFIHRIEDDTVYPQDKSVLKKQSLADFLYNPYTGISSFINCLTPATKIKPKSDDKYPKVTEALITRLTEYTGKTISNGIIPHAVKAVEKIAEAFDAKGYNKLTYTHSRLDQLDIFWEFYTGVYYDPAKVNPLFIDSDDLMSRFQNHLIETGYLGEDHGTYRAGMVL